MAISILIGLAIGVAGWLIGNKRAREQLAASPKP